MEPGLEIAASQLQRMRGMNAAYHDRFFSDVRFTTLVSLALFALGLVVSPWFYLAVPVICLLGACQTAFDASYLIFSRHYATRLERYINDRLGENVLVASEMESTYLFPLDDTKVVTLRFGSDFTWFGFMTGLYTVVGVITYIIGVALSLQVFANESAVVVGGGYLVVLAILTVTALAVGGWWFVGGEGERRLASSLDRTFLSER